MWPFETSTWYLRPKTFLDADTMEVHHLPKEEVAKRMIEACDFIVNVGKRLNFPYRTIATAQLYFQIFFATHSMTEYPHMDIALTCLLVGCKGEETYKKIRQILSAAFLTLNPDFTGSELEVKIVEEHRLRVVQYEHLVLEAIDYEFAVQHPFAILAELCQTLHIREEESLQAYEFCRQCYYSPIILCYPPEYIALAAILKLLNKLRFLPPTFQQQLDKMAVYYEDITDVLYHYRKSAFIKS